MIINKQTLNLKIMNKLTKTNTPKNCTEMYLEYVNDWLTLESMAEYHNLEIKDLERIIEIGKKEHNTKSNTPLKIMKTYYRVFDTQRGDYFATGYNAESMQELISDFQSYILTANEVEDSEENINGFLSNWDGIAEHLQGAELEESNTPFEEVEY